MIIKLFIISYEQLKCVLDAQRNRPIETVLLSNHSICFG